MNRLGLRDVNSIVMLLFVAVFAHGGWALVHYHQASENESGPSTNSAKPDTSKWQLYRNEKYGFQVKYPETWAVSSSRGTAPEIIYFKGPNSGVIGQALNVTVQLNINPGKLSIQEWFAEQLRAIDASKIEARGCSGVGGRPACFFELKSGKQRFVYTLLHQTDVLSFDYKLGTADSPSYAAIIDSFQILN